jgi:uncharacterized damage-inducible protein DinB
MPGQREQFLDVLRKECATTLKVMRAYPAGKPEFKPHERSASAKALMHAFGLEQNVTIAAINGTLKMPPTGLPPEPPTVADAISAFEKGSQELQQLVAKTPDGRLDETIMFFTGPKQMGEVTIQFIMWLMLMDQVHHRGQLSVYIRMAGGKVPSIYGPSADEPWN